MRRYLFLLLLIPLAATNGQGCLQPAPSAVTVVEQSPLRVLPRRSVGLLVVEVGALRDRRPIAAWLSNIASGTEQKGALQAMMERFGTEIVNRVDRIALAAVPMEDEQFGFGLLAEGEFDEATLRDALGDSDILTLLELSEKPDLSVTVLEGGTLCLGPRSVLEDIRGIAAGSSEGLERNRVLMTLLEKVAADAQVWGAIDYAPMAKLAGRTVGDDRLANIPLPGRAPGGSLQAIAFQGTVDDPIDFEIVGQAALEDDAARLADAARGLIAIGRMAAAGDQNRAGLISLLDTIDISQSGAYVNVRGAVPYEMLSRFAGGFTIEDGDVLSRESIAVDEPDPREAEPGDPSRPDLAETVP